MIYRFKGLFIYIYSTCSIFSQAKRYFINDDIINTWIPLETAVAVFNGKVILVNLFFI